MRAVKVWTSVPAHAGFVSALGSVRSTSEAQGSGVEPGLLLQGRSPFGRRVPRPQPRDSTTSMSLWLIFVRALSPTDKCFALSRDNVWKRRVAGPPAVGSRGAGAGS